MEKNRKDMSGIHALKISIFYSLAGLGWVILSVAILSKVFNMHDMIRIGILKDILYIGITVYPLYALIRRYDVLIKHSNEVQQSEERKFRELFENANDAIFIYELQSDYSPSKFIEVNRVACEQLQYTRNELLAMSPKEIIEESYLKKNATLINEGLEKDSVTMESSHVSKDGREIPCELSLRIFTFEGKKMALSIATTKSDSNMIPIFHLSRGMRINSSRCL